jgi:hypothetical protein
MTLREPRATGDVQLLDRVNQPQAFALRDRPDTLGLLAWRHEPIAVAISDSGPADDPDGRRTEVSLVSRRGTPST